MYASSRDTLTAWWSGFTDPESGIKSFNVRLLSGDSCLIHGVDNLTTVIDWTELSANSSSYDFTHLSLQVFSVVVTELSSNSSSYDFTHLSLQVFSVVVSELSSNSSSYDFTHLSLQVFSVVVSKLSSNSSSYDFTHLSLQVFSVVVPVLYCK